MVAGGVREEVQRGFILHRFDQFLGGAAAGVIVFSVFFGLGHLEQGFDAAIATGTLGAFWGVVYVRRRSIVAPMVSHAGFNLAQLAKYFVVA
jgi:membrane protease YdiL (CAAX protease family)